ncbi:MAG: fructoselysine 6-kinase [Rhodobacteraceae bacterium]|uniref:PfkB family carbohydrate kinase n=1 Tax=Cypionkella sp. TaxID=2811411 RepID=UPI001320B12D|nr:PfkB family carbohydrate kinase [Cypionkella sp.]KAF0171266.1 MAG: fructoselysine 6-kinase [Paracoccaceae bacterium]MDO8327066.1 PfkB family carbohydrate kinase [Cypionkella sp.]
MTQTPPRFATLGDNCIDRYLPLNQAAVGGNAVNVAVQIVRAGEACHYFGAVGRDAAGRWTRKTLIENRVAITHLQELDAPTAYTDIDVDANGERIIAFEDFGASALYAPTPADLTALAQMDHIHIGWFKAAAALRLALQGRGVTFSQDVAVNPDAAGLEIGFESVGPSEPMARAALQRLQAAGCRVAVVTCGAMGSVATEGGDIVATGIRAIQPVVDTTGAGDTFIAGFLSAWKRGQPLAACLAGGRDAAAVTCGHVGGFPQRLRALKNDARSTLTDV